MDLSNHILKNADLKATELTNTKLPKDLSGCNLHYVNIKDRDLSEHILKGANLKSAILNENTKLPNDHSDCNLSHCDLSKQNLSKYTKNVNLEHIKLMSNKIS